MDAARRKRLEADGWKSGTVADFLGLSEDESLYIEMKLDLPKAVKARREKLGLTQKELAKRLESSQARVAAMEAGRYATSMDLLVRALLALGATAKEVGQVFASVKVPTLEARPKAKATRVRAAAKTGRVKKAR